METRYENSPCRQVKSGGVNSYLIPIMCGIYGSKWNWDLDKMIIIDTLAVVRKKVEIHVLGLK